MHRAPHLFVPVFGRIWLAVPDHGLALRPPGAIKYNRLRSTGDRAPEEDSISEWLMAQLAQNGPMRAVDLRDGALREFDGRIEATSVGPVMLMNPVFIRLAPGLFGLPDHLTELSNEGATYPDSFFSNTHCRYFIFARRAGEPMDLYPGWSYTFEAQLCQWAQQHSPIDLYRSLLYVAEPDNWPVSSEERSSWHAQKVSYGSYRLLRETPTIDDADVPKPEHLLATLAYLGTLGKISWVSVNRITRERTDSTDAVAGLALLIVLNAIHPATHWQEPHVPSVDSSVLYARLTSDLRRSGCLSWREGQLRLLLLEAAVKLTERRFGWVGRNEARALIDHLLTETVTEAGTTYSEPADILGPDWATQF
jgi:hypothetical protein